MMLNWFRKKRRASRSLREHWRWHLEVSEESFTSMLGEDVIWPTWHLSRNPERMAAMEFHYATTILCGGGDRELADGFVARAAEILDRIDEEEKLQSEHCLSSYPANAGTSLIVKALIELYHGAAPDGAVYAEAAAHYIEYARGAAADGAWDAVDQYNYLSAIELFLLAEKPDNASDARRNAPLPLDRNARQLAAIDDILHRVETGHGDCRNFVTYFHSTRDPRISAQDMEFYSFDIEPVVLSLLSLRYLSERDSNEIAWSDVVSCLIE